MALFVKLDGVIGAVIRTAITWITSAGSSKAWITRKSPTANRIGSHTLNRSTPIARAAGTIIHLFRRIISSARGGRRFSRPGLVHSRLILASVIAGVNEA